MVRHRTGIEVFAVDHRLFKGLIATAADEREILFDQSAHQQFVTDNAHVKPVAQRTYRLEKPLVKVDDLGRAGQRFALRIKPRGVDYQPLFVFIMRI